MGERTYDWVEEDGELPSAACFTAAVGVTVDDVLRALGADHSTEPTATFAASFDELTGWTPLVVDELDDAVLAAENNGWLGSRSEVVEAISRGGRAASVYWSVNADMSFLYAEDGVVVAWFDPVLVEHPWSGSDPGWVRERARDLRFGVGRPRSDSLVLLERLTGVRVERSWLERPHRCFDVPDPESAPLSVGAYTSFVRQALRAWWRSLLGRR